MDAEQALVAAEAERPRFDPWKLRVWMNARDVTCEKLAAECGLSGRASLEVSRWQTYRTPVGPTLLARIAKALGIEQQALLSNMQEWERNLGRYESWRADKRPPLAAWVARNP